MRFFIVRLRLLQIYSLILLNNIYLKYILKIFAHKEIYNREYFVFNYSVITYDFNNNNNIKSEKLQN